MTSQLLSHTVEQRYRIAVCLILQVEDTQYGYAIPSLSIYHGFIAGEIIVLKPPIIID